MDAPVGKPYEGPSGVGRDSIWLTAEDLVEGRDATAKIEQVILYPKVLFQGGRERLNMLGLKFVGKSRILGLNATNRKVLNRMFSTVTKAWIGQEITLYVGETQLKGETVKCVRVRDRGSRVASAAEEFLSGDAEPHVDEAPGQSDSSDITPQVTPVLLTLGWTQQQIDTVNAGCEAIGLSHVELDKIVRKFKGNYDAVYRELNRRADDAAA